VFLFIFYKIPIYAKKIKMLGPISVILICNFLSKICYIIKIKCQIIIR